MFRVSITLNRLPELISNSNTSQYHPFSQLTFSFSFSSEKSDENIHENKKTVAIVMNHMIARSTIDIYYVAIDKIE